MLKTDKDTSFLTNWSMYLLYMFMIFHKTNGLFSPNSVTSVFEFWKNMNFGFISWLGTWICIYAKVVYICISLHLHLQLWRLSESGSYFLQNCFDNPRAYFKWRFRLLCKFLVAPCLLRTFLVKRRGRNNRYWCVRGCTYPPNRTNKKGRK